MKVSEVITRVRNTSGDTTSLQFTDTQIVDWINDGIRECAINNNLLQKRASQNTVIGQSDYDLPTDILKLHSVKYDNEKLPVLTMEEFDERYTGADGSISGRATVAYIWAGKLTLYPKPDIVYPLVVDYIYHPVAHASDAPGLTAELSLPVGYHNRIVDYCLAQVAQQDDDLNRYQIKMQQFETGVQNLKDQGEWNYDLYPSISVDSRDMGEAILGGDYEW